MVDLKETFDKYEKEFLEFDRIENKLNDRPDIHAFLLLDKLFPSKGRDIISAAEHDMFYLDIDCEVLAENITEADVLDLVRCGIFYDDETDGLAMYT